MNWRGLAARAAILLSLSLAAAFAFAESPSPDPAMERRARLLFGQIRCVVCQSQSIGESDSAIAADMRTLIRERMAAGESDAQILDYLASRYGDFVRFKPPFTAATLALWVGPFVGLAAALAGAYLVLRRRETEIAPALDAAEKARLSEMLRDGPNQDRDAR